MSDEPRIIQLPKILDDRGNLSFIEGARHVPFEIARAYWVYDVPGGDARDGHAYRRNRELIVALSGSFDVVLGDGPLVLRLVCACRNMAAAHQFLHQLVRARARIGALRRRRLHL